MEELHRLHKDVPFGWVAMLQDLFAHAARRAASRERGAQVERPRYQAGDLHHLAGPH